MDWLVYGYMALCALVWAAMASGRWERLAGADYSLAVRTTKTDKSAWLKAQVGRRAKRWFVYTLPLVVVAMPFVSPWVALMLPLLHSVAVGWGVRLQYRKLARAWDLWQQLGYDGPPNLEAQANSLQHPPHA